MIPLPRLTPRVGLLMLGVIAAVAWFGSPASGQRDDAGDTHDWPAYGDLDRSSAMARFTSATPSGPDDRDAGKVPLKQGDKGGLMLAPAHRDDGPMFYADTDRSAFAQAGFAQSTTVNCTGDGQSGPRVQALYVRASGAPDNYQASLPAIVDAMAEANTIVEGSAASRGSARSIRWVHDTACAPVVISETVSSAALSSFGVMIDELRQKGYATAQRTWMVFADSNAYCGIAQSPTDDRAWPNNVLATGAESLYARADTFCWDPVTVAHELFHTFGAVQDSAPGSNRAGHCNDGEDVMCYPEPAGVGTYRDDVCPGNNRTLLDCQHDTYFNPTPDDGSYLATSWNTADSIYLQGGRDPQGGSTPPPPPADDPIGDPPANDDISAATILLSSQPAAVDNRGATLQPGEPAHAGVGGANSVWYAIDAAQGETISVSVSQSTFDPVAAMYSGVETGTLTAIAANDDAVGLNPFLQVQAPATGRYLIAVAGYQSGRGTATITAEVTGVGAPPPPNPGDIANDDLAGAITLGDGQSADFDLAAATTEAGEPNHHGVSGAASLWYRIDAPAGEGVTVSVSSNFDPVAAVYTLPPGGGPADLQLVASNDDTVGVQPQLWVESDGRPLHVAIAGFNESRGAGTVSVVLGGEPPGADGVNDVFASATPVSGSGGQFAIDTVGATAEPGEPRHLGVGQNSVWYAISAEAGDLVTIDVTSDFDPVAALYTGSAVGGLTLVAQDDDSGLGFQPRLSVTHPGQTLHLAIAGYGSAQGRGTLTVTIGGGGGAEVDRVAGSNRVLTAIAASQAKFPQGGAPAVVLTTSGTFPDALSGGPFSVSVGAPILLTRASALEPEVLEEVNRLRPRVVYLLGGPAALSAEVESALRSAGHDTQRLAGPTRAETATAVSATFPAGREFVHVVNGRDWRAAMIAAGHAGLFGEPVLLVEPGTVPQATAAELQRLAPTIGIVVHNIDGEIAPEVVTSLSAFGDVYLNAGPTPADLGATLLAVSGVPAAVAAADHNFPDGLSGGQFGLPVILVPQRGPVDRGLLAAIAEHDIGAILVLGGEAAVGQEVLRQLGG